MKTVLDNSYVLDRTRNKMLPQIISALSCLVGVFSVGTTSGWITPALDKLEGDDSPIPTTSSEGSSMLSIIAVGGILGPILYAWKVDWLGRRWMAVFGSIFLTIGWLILIFSAEVYHLYIARIFTGLGVGYTLALCPTYIGEIADNRVRSLFGVCHGIMTSLGTIFEFAVGPYVDFYVLNYINIAFPILMLLSVYFMVESPYFLIRQGKEDLAINSLMKLRDGKKLQDVEEEMIAIKAFVENSPKRPFKEVVKELGLKSNRKAIIILTTILISQQFNGASSVKSYFYIIIKETESPLDPNLTVLGSEILGLCVLITSIYLIQKFGRKTLFLFTSFGCLFGTFITGLYFMLWYEGVIDTSTSWLAMLGLFTIQLSYGVGGYSIPVIIASEMSTASIRSWFGGYKAVTLSSSSAICFKVFQVITDSIGEQYAFWMFTVFMIVTIIILIIILPETKGKNLQEIQDILSGKKTNRRGGEDENVKEAV